MKIPKILCIFIVLVFLVSVAAYGATIHVPGDFATIQQAIYAAANDDTIMVAPSIYNEQINFIGKTITVRSDTDGDPATYDISPGSTIIHGVPVGGIEHAVTIADGEGPGTTLDGFTVRNGSPNISIGWPPIAPVNATVKNCIVTGGVADDDAGIVVGPDSHATIINTIVYGNEAVTRGGGITVALSSSAEIINSTISANITGEPGAGIVCDNSSYITLINSVVWGNVAPGDQEIAITNNSTVTASYSNVKGGQSKVFVDGTSTLNWFTGTNIDSDPLFVNTVGNDFHLTSSSPCIDVGKNDATGVPDTDLDGNPRIIDGDNNGIVTVDMGAYEFFESAPKPPPPKIKAMPWIPFLLIDD